MTVRTLEELFGKLNSFSFSPEQVQILAEVADALVKPVKANSHSRDPILGSTVFLNYFSNVLLLHHATHEEKFKKKAFEYAFRGACRALGLRAQLTANAVLPGADVVVGNEKFSVKTEAERRVSSAYIKISKLMEARWIRDVAPKATRGAEAIGRVMEHLQQYHRILTLRAFDMPETVHVRYELWEIPLDTTLRLIGTLKESDFSTPTTNNSYSAIVRINGVALFSFRLDGSVEKVTISGLRTSACIRHASWEVPTVPPSDENGGESGDGNGE
jgi:hypothetical protein